MNRRDFLTAGAVGAAATALPAMARPDDTAAPQAKPAGTGRLNHSVCRWCYGGIALEDLCANVKPMGVKSVELLGEKDWPVVKAHGLTCAVANGPTTIGEGINRTETHDRFVKECERLLPLVKAAGIPTMIVFSGNRRGMKDDEGLANCAKALKRVTPMAEAAGVTIIMELLNSKVDHGDYMCDHTPWGVELVKQVGSDRFRLLYDIYHMQIMEGDVIRTIGEAHPWIAHYHTGGNPGRNEIDATQELNYTAIAKAIADSGYQGFLGQEFIPRRDPMKSLAEAIVICTV